MASKIDITLKRYNGTDNDTIYPTTHLGQIYTDNTETTLLNTYLDNTFIKLTEKGSANGVAPLDGLSKIPEIYLPSSVLGGLKFISSLNADTDLDTLGSSQDSPNDSGAYWIASEDLTLTTSGASTVLAPGDEGDNDLGDGILIEAGDWVILSSWTDDPSAAYEFAIVNNTYRAATTTARGIVTLTDAADISELVDGAVEVITEDFLFDTVKEGDMATGTGANDYANLNGIAGSEHHHDSRYYKEDEVQEFFAGTTAITGYNKTNWDDAYDDQIVSAAFAEAAEEANASNLTLTQQDGGTIVVDLNNDTRYYREEEINDWLSGASTLGPNNDSYTPIEYGADPTSTVTGAILIDID